MASRKAIDMLMQGIKKRKNQQIWVPSGEQAKYFHAAAGGGNSPNPKPVKSKF